MGGRKSSRVEKIVGSSKQLQPQKRDFIKAVKSQNSEKIVSSSVKYFSSSKIAFKNLAKATELLDFIDEEENKKELDYQKRKEIVTKKWSEIKEKFKIESSSEIDRIFIESATKVIRRGKK